MAIIVDEKTRLIVQGITGHQGMFHTKAMKEFGTQVVAGVTPGKYGQTVEGVPVFDSVEQAMGSVDDINTSIIFVPAPYAKDAAFEAMDADIKTIIIITEHIPFHDMLQVVHYAKYNKVTLIGPNCPGIVSPGKCKVGIMPNKIFKTGNVGVLSRSGTLTYEIVNGLSQMGIGQSTCIGLGGDPVVGTNFEEALKLFEKDPATEKVVLVGEIGGSAEEQAAKYIKRMKKPVFAYIAGQSAPPGKRMGHAGAIITRGMGTASSKIEALTKAGAKVARLPSEIPRLIHQTVSSGTEPTSVQMVSQ